MKARELVNLLLEQDPDAEVMVSAPLECAQDPGLFNVDVSKRKLVGRLDLPTRGLDAGLFQTGPNTGKPWVMVIGTDVWGMSPPARPMREPDSATDVLRIGVDGEGLTRIVQMHYQQGRHDLALQLLATCPTLTMVDAYELLHGRKKFTGVVRGPADAFQLWGDSNDDGVGK